MGTGERMGYPQGMNEDLLRRLRQLGVVKGTGRLKPPPPPSRPVPQAELPGETVETPYGPCHVVETRYPGDHRHGPTPLRSLLDCPSATLAHLADLPDLAEVDLSRLFFLDTETTGLAGGTGTIPFLVGLGRFEGGQFVLRQYFLRDPDQERAMLHLLSHQMEQAQALVSFNGRGFDVPFLVGRSLVHGIPARVDLLSGRFSLRPHLDLYHAFHNGGRARGPASLDVMCWALGIESPKEQMDGSMVAPAYERGEIEKIAEYNAHDVRATAAVYHRLRDGVLRFRSDW